MMMAPTAWISRSVLASDIFLRYTGALTCRTCRLTCRLIITAICTYRLVMNFTRATIGFTSIAWHTQQLNVGCFTTTPAGIRRNVIVLQIG